jgi:light-regulated signal transduction histidine kinase (bacteriophytochrome)
MTVDLTNCEREPIHIPGSIQPHGLLLALAAPTWTIIQVSANSADLIDTTPDALLGHAFLQFLPPDSRSAYDQLLSTADTNFSTPLRIPFQVRGKPLIFDGMLHRQNSVVILELENPTAADAASAPNLDPQPYDHFLLLRRAMTRLQSAGTLQEAAAVVAQEVYRFTGFDRVMIYRFHEDDHGEVIAEARADDLEAFLGLHYPASDIPPQARRLYTLNWLRLIADVNYRPVPLVPQQNPLTNAPLDLSHASLRSVSPIHIQYLQNMGVGASMSISLLKDEALWGLIACHHRTAKFIPFHVRAACEALGVVMSAQLTAKETNSTAANLSARLEKQMRVLEAMSEAGLAAGLTRTTDILDLVEATGCAVVLDGAIHTIGVTPAEEIIRALLPWLRQQFRTNPGDTIFATNQLPARWPAADSAVASGLLAIAIAAGHQDYLLFFRPEVIQTVNWGGNPNKPVELSADGVAQLSPRRSFALWRETVYRQATAWSETDLAQAAALHRAIGRYIIQRAEELAALNRQLEARNNELDSFAYVASHDLKEPLRGIYSHAFYLEERHRAALTEDAYERLTGLMRLAKRMDELLDALLRYSRLGRMEIERQTCDLNELVAETLEMVAVRIADTEIRMPSPLPTVEADYILLREVYANLISNAVKYNDKATPWIEIGYITEDVIPLNESQPAENAPEPGPRSKASSGVIGSTPVYYVRDNGIGILEQHHERIFDIFRRLHGRGEYGGGSGAGLAIVKKIIERHGGQIWVESQAGAGTTFYFTLTEQ